MKQITKLEFHRAFHNRRLLIVVLLGIGIGVFHLFERIISLDLMSAAECIERNAYPVSVFNRWMGLDGSSFQNALFYTVFPILAAYPYGGSYYEDLQSGYIKNIYTRAEKKQYGFAKYGAVFTSGGVAVLVPLLFSLLATMLLLPSMNPEPITGEFRLYSDLLWSTLFMDQPYVYVGLYLVMDFVFGGLFACLCLSASFFISNKYIVVLAPFALYMALLALFSSTNIPPYMLLRPSQQHAGNIWIILIEAILLFGISASIFWYKGMKDDTF